MKPSILLFLIFFYGINLNAQDKKIAMMLPIKNSEGIKDMVSDMVRGELTRALTKEPGYSAFSRNELDKVAEEYKFQESGMVDEEQRREIGKMLGADYVCISKISKDGDSYYIQAFLVNIESGQISDPGTAFAKGDFEKINFACQQVAADMIGKKVPVQEKVTTQEPIKENKTTASHPQKKVDTNPNNFQIIEVEVNFNKHQIMICDKAFTDNMPFVQAAKACENLNYGGYSDWRLPTVHEGVALYKIYHSLANKPYRLSWTSSKDERGFVYTFNGSHSSKLQPPNSKWSVLPVRDFK